MKSSLKSIATWLFALFFTFGIALYQRITGPSYPISGEAEIGQQWIRYKLIRTWDGTNDAPVKIVVPDTTIRGEIVLRRFKSYDKWQTVRMERNGDTLTGFLPHQPPAGKIMYMTTLIKGDERILLNEHPAVLRFKGFVPGYYLYPHIFFIFLAMLFSTLTGLRVLFRMKNTYLYVWLTVLTLALGGMILGPVVQKFSFGDFWTGWPFGHDLTDNKSLVAFIFWVIALVVVKKHRENRLWPVIAAIVLWVIFLIPHSVLGSEIDFTKEQKTENTK